MPYQLPPNLQSMTLDAIADAIANRQLPPLEDWNPCESGDSEVKITALGEWLHEGRPITRPAMVRAFSSLVTRDANGQHWLITPQCRLSVEVDDAAFLAVDVQRKGAALTFMLNTDDLVVADAAHPLIARGEPDCPAVYLLVRRGCEARLNRSTWLQLAHLADADLTVSSQGQTFSLQPA